MKYVEPERTVCDCCYSYCEKCHKDFCLMGDYLVTENGEVYCGKCVRKSKELRAVYLERYGSEIGK